MKPMTVDEVLTRRVAKVLPNKEGLAKVMAAKKIRLYQGFDPTGGKLHLGHTIGLRKLMEFANLGHDVTFLFGTGTVLAGDPSERSSGRRLITQEEIDENIKGWKKQVGPIVDFEKITIKQNGDWLTKLTLKDIINIGSNISATQLFKRESFQRRIDQGDTVWFHETFYPLLQGYDSVVMDVDLEIGGTDQEFNMLVGRELQRKMNNREKYVLTVPLIVGTDGQQMSKSTGNCVWLEDTNEDMFGKLMRVSDRHIHSYWMLLTDLPETSEQELLKDPLNNKKKLAFDIVRQFHGETQAKEAQSNFESTVQGGEIPQEVTEFRLQAGKYTILDICKAANLEVSSGQIKRTIEQGGVEWNAEKITDFNMEIEVVGGEVLKFGKRIFRKVE